MAQRDSDEGLAAPRLTPDSSPVDIAQWAVNFMHCRDSRGDPRVLDVQTYTSTPLPGAAPEWESPRPQASVTVAGDFLLNGMAPGWSGWASQIELQVDLVQGTFPFAMHASEASLEPQPLPETTWDVRATTACEGLPSPSRDPRLPQNCDARNFAIVPRICGWIDPQEYVQLSIEDDAVVPTVLTLPRRTQVTWVNHGEDQHTIAGPGWQLPVVMNPGDTWTVAYAGPGTYEYSCTIHPDMHLSLTLAELPPAVRPDCLALNAQGAACLFPTPTPQSSR
jgi:hypothetical protein